MAISPFSVVYTLYFLERDPPFFQIVGTEDCWTDAFNIDEIESESFNALNFRAQATFKLKLWLPYDKRQIH